LLPDVELSLELLDPLRRRLMWRVTAAWNVIEEERLIMCSRVQVAQMLDGLVSHIGGEVITLLADPGKYLAGIAKQVGRILVGLAAHESIKIFEPPCQQAIGQRALSHSNY